MLGEAWKHFSMLGQAWKHFPERPSGGGLEVLSMLGEAWCAHWKYFPERPSGLGDTLNVRTGGTQMILKDYL
jgi:hypothetical protein